MIYSYNKSQQDAFSQLYFDNEIYMFRTELLSIIRSLNTVFTEIGICHINCVECLIVSSGTVPSRPR